nr:FAD synthase-like [Leptinotarsa decemlineata]
MASRLLNKTGGKILNSVRYNTISEVKKVAKAGIIVVGDEVLKGVIQDTNSNYLAVELHKIGVRLKKISVIGDNIEEVSKEVRHFSDSFDYVLTTGGIGPTHDDITYEAVAKAFNEKLVLNTELKDICLKFYDTIDINCPGMKMAYIPESSKLNFKAGIQGPKMNYPNVSVNNVFIFPGVPEMMKKSFSIVKEVFQSNEKFYAEFVYLTVPEIEIINILETVVKEFPNVEVGVYPVLFNKFYKVKVTIESCEEKSTRQAYDRMISLIPKDFIVDSENIK